MTLPAWLSTFDLGVAAHFSAQIAALVRVLLRSDREPAVRAGWLVLIFTLPVAGIALYLLIGETRLNQRVARRQRDALETLPRPAPGDPSRMAALDPAFRPAFARAASVNGFAVAQGPAITLLAEPEDQSAALIAAIEGARESVHLITYIWLDDATGRAVAAALARAAGRGVAVRVLVDGLGGRSFIDTPGWRAMQAAGAQTAIAFPFHWWLLKLMSSRIDLRNHRKLVVIDGATAIIGSRNIADPAFRPKARYAPWIDVMLRIEGAPARQHQHIFAADWLTHTGENLSPLLDAPDGPAMPDQPATAVAFATGPLLDSRGVPDTFLALIGAASESLTITTPYFVPGEAIATALRAAAIRGVRVQIVLPRRNDSRFVGFASRSYYPALTEAGVEIHEHGPGLLHAKTLLADGRVALIGSANLDRRSFELNYENVVLAEEATLARDLAALQAHWIAQSRRVDPGAVARWRWPRRLIDNLISILAPVL